jgi:hypothetical protein
LFFFQSFRARIGVEKQAIFNDTMRSSDPWRGEIPPER